MRNPEGQNRNAILPAWISEGVDTYCDDVIGAASPYPYSQPDDLDSYICLHLNDYLRLSSRPEVLKAKADAIRMEGNLFLASTVFTGGRGMEEHHAFRALLAQAGRSEDALLASSGWAANVGLIEALAKRDTPIYLDRKAHASMWDGAQLSQGRSIMLRHNDPEFLEKRIRRDGAGIVCIDAFYSNTGSVADVAAYVDICERTGSILILDEAHSLCVVGEGGGGLAVQAGVADRVHFRTASFSKAIGGHGGCILASRHLTWFLTHRAHSILFSSSALACDSAAHRAALTIVGREPELGIRTMEKAATFRRELAIRGIDTGTSGCQIVPVEFPSEAQACRFYELLRRRGVLTSVFLPPAVPDKTGLVRFSVHSEVSEKDLLFAADASAEALDEMGIERLSNHEAA
jgi:CAI-1 autoinducer synthase